MNLPPCVQQTSEYLPNYTFQKENVLESARRAHSAQQVFLIGHKKAEMSKMRRTATSLLISSPAISCFLTDASTKSGKSDQHFKDCAAAASPRADEEEESSFLLAPQSCSVSSPVTQSRTGGKI